MRRLIVGGVVAAALVVAGAGCIAVGGSDKTVRTFPTLGQELRDLKLARDTGAINDTEYEQARARLLGTRPAMGN